MGANTFHFYERVNQIVQEEPNEAQNPDLLGLLAAIGIEQGKAFVPDERMKAILTDAAAVANATARPIVFDTRDKEAYSQDSALFRRLGSEKVALSAEYFRRTFGSDMPLMR